MNHEPDVPLFIQNPLKNALTFTVRSIKIKLSNNIRACRKPDQRNMRDICVIYARCYLNEVLLNQGVYNEQNKANHAVNTFCGNLCKTHILCKCIVALSRVVRHFPMLVKSDHEKVLFFNELVLSPLFLFRRDRGFLRSVNTY